MTTSSNTPDTERKTYARRLADGVRLACWHVSKPAGKQAGAVPLLPPRLTGRRFHPTRLVRMGLRRVSG